MDKSTHETDGNDPSIGVTEALSAVDVGELSYVQLRRLYSALVEATNEVDEEIARRSGSTTALGETVRFESPRRREPER